MTAHEATCYCQSCLQDQLAESRARVADLEAELATRREDMRAIEAVNQADQRALRAELAEARAFSVTPHETAHGRPPATVTNAVLCALGWDGDTDDRRYWYTASHVAHAAIAAWHAPAAPAAEAAS